MYASSDKPESRNTILARQRALKNVRSLRASQDYGVWILTPAMDNPKNRNLMCSRCGLTRTYIPGSLIDMACECPRCHRFMTAGWRSFSEALRINLRLLPRMRPWRA